MIQQSAKLLNCTLETAESLRRLMTATAEQLPEYDTVLGMYGVGRVLAPQLMAEIGDTRRLLVLTLLRTSRARLT